LAQVLAQELETSEAFEQLSPRGSFLISSMAVAEHLVFAEQATQEIVHTTPFTNLTRYVQLPWIYAWDDKHIDGEALEASLARVLNYYHAVAGRIATKQLTEDERGMKVYRVDANNQGVSFEVAVAPGSSRIIPSMGEVMDRGEYINYPDRFQALDGKAPLFTAKLTLFEDGGCCLGLTAHHILFDGSTFAMFMKDWSELHNNRPVEAVRFDVPTELAQAITPDELAAMRKAGEAEPVFPSWLTRRLLPAALKRGSRPVPRSPRTVVLHFSDERLNEIKANAMERNDSWVSTTEALAAHVLGLALEILEVPDEFRKNFAVDVVLNLRGRFPGVGLRSAGSLVTVGSLHLDHLGTAAAAQEIHTQMRKVVDAEYVVPRLRFLNRIIGNNELWKSPVVSFRLGTIINAQLHTPYWEIDFGAGRPDRGIPWGGEPLKFLRGVAGGVDVLVACDSDDFMAGILNNAMGAWVGHAPWHRLAPRAVRSFKTARKWLVCCLVVSLVVAAFGANREACAVMAVLIAVLLAALQVAQRNRSAWFFAELQRRHALGSDAAPGGLSQSRLSLSKLHSE